MLKKARESGITPDYCTRLLEAVEGEAKKKSVELPSVPGLVEALSRRELEVVKLLAQGCSDKVISEALVISPQTVHKHLKNIYGKLGVHNRTEAVIRSQALGLI